MPAATAPARAQRPAARRHRSWPAGPGGPLAALGAALVLAACGSGSGPAAGPTVTVTQPGASTPVSTPPTAPAAGGEPGIVGVTTAGALVLIDPASGQVTGTLVTAGVRGDEISVSPDGSTVYFAQGSGCTPEIKSVPASGGSPAPVAAGQQPAVSPDGSKLAFARQPLLTPGCVPSESNFAGQYKLVIRTLATGAEKILPLPPQVRSGGLPAPISHLSWSADGVRLAVSTLALQDNEGWGLNIVNTATAPYYVPPSPGVTFVPVTGSPDVRRSYIREGVFLPDGNLFISRACCGGVPVHNTSRLMWEVTTTGAFVHQVALGYPALEHISLAVSPTGQWLLYLAGNDLYVSENGARPSKVATGLIAATWR
jgi:WD40-like Beta Propeller Repeat